MTASISAWITLVLGLIGLLFAWCGLMPRKGSIDKLSAWYLGFALPGSEMSTLLATLGLVMGAVLWALGAAEGLAGRIGFAFFALAILGLLWAMWRARDVARLMREQIAAVLGARWDDGVAPVRRALIQPALRVASWWRPFHFKTPRVAVRRNIDFVPNAHKQQRLDVLTPATPGPAPRPVLVNIHGGGWMIGEKGTQAMPLQVHMAANGWVVVDADYRLSPGARMPDHLLDVKAALAWVRRNIAEHGGDPRFIALTGGSAGGHLVALAALTANQPRWQPGFEEVDTHVQVCVPYYGKFDIDGSRVPDPGLDDFFARNIMPGPRLEHEQLWRDMAPVNHLAGPAALAVRPPFMVLQGRADVLIPVDEARWFVDQLRTTADSELIYIELPHTQHGFDVPNSPRAQLHVEVMQAYLEVQYANWCRAQGVTPAAN